MLRSEFQDYLKITYPKQTVSGFFPDEQIHIRFELGDELENGTLDRVVQSVERAYTLFNDTFKNPNNEIWVLIYEYLGENISNSPNEYLHKQFPLNKFSKFYNQIEKIDSGSIMIDEKGNEIIDNDECLEKIIIGKIPICEINIRAILNGIANTEMGFDPGIDQRVFFLDPDSNKGFHMYDDRGCLIWSNKAETIKQIYNKRNNWIVDYHRKDIDEYFE